MMVLEHPADQSPGTAMESISYIQSSTAFGLCLAPKLCTAVFHALVWAMMVNGIHNALRYLDNFFFCLPPLCQMLWISQSIMFSTCVQGSTKQNILPILSASLPWYRDQLCQTGTPTATTKANPSQEHHPTVTSDTSSSQTIKLLSKQHLSYSLFVYLFHLSLRLTLALYVLFVLSF